MKKLINYLSIIAAVFIVLIIIGLIVLKLVFPAEKTLAILQEQASAKLGRPVHIASMDYSIWGGLGLQLNDVVIENPENFPGDNFLSAENVDLKLSLLPLLKGNFEVDRFIINKPNINLIKAADGLTNYDFNLADTSQAAEAINELPPEQKISALAISFDAFEINNAAIFYNDLPAAMKLSLKEMSLETNLENPSEGNYASTGEVNIGSITIDNPVAIKDWRLRLEYTADVDLKKGDIAINEAKLALNGIETVSKINIKDIHAGPIVQINSQANNVDILEFLKMIPEEKKSLIAGYQFTGLFNLDSDFEISQSGDSSNFNYSGTADLSEFTVGKENFVHQLVIHKAAVSFKNDNVRLHLENSALASRPIKGHLVLENFSDPAIIGELSGNISLADFKAFLPDTTAYEIKGIANFDLKFSGPVTDFENLNYSGLLMIDSGSVTSRVLPEPIKSFTLDSYLDRKVVKVRALACKFPSGDLNFSGQVDNIIDYLMADSLSKKKINSYMSGALSGKVDLAFVESFLPQEADPKMSGVCNVDLQITGNLNDLNRVKPYGRITVKNGSYSDTLFAEKVTSIQSDISISPDTIFINELALTFESSDLSITGKLADPFPYFMPFDKIENAKVSHPYLTFNISSHLFNSDKLFPEAVPGSKLESDKTITDSVLSVPLPDITGLGKFTVDTLVYSEINFTEITGDMKIEGKKISCYNARGKAYDGSITGETTIDLSDFSNPRYDGVFNATQIEVSHFAQRFTKFGNFISGKCDLSGKYQATGMEPLTFLNSLSMNGKGSLRDGKLVTSGAVYEAFQNLASKAGKSFSPNQSLRSLFTNIKVQDGKVTVDDFETVISGFGDLSVSGFYGFDGSLSYSGTLLTTEEITKELLGKGGLLGGLTDLLADQSSGRVPLPLKIDGTLDSPKVSIDYTALSKNAAENLKKKGTNFLDNLIKKK